MEDRRAEIEATTRELLATRDGRTACPSEVARAIGGEGWRDLMPLVREVAAGMPDVVLTQRGAPVGPDVKGPIRLGRAG